MTHYFHLGPPGFVSFFILFITSCLDCLTPLAQALPLSKHKKGFTIASFLQAVKILFIIARGQGGRWGAWSGPEWAQERGGGRGTELSRKANKGFPGGAVVKNPPANAGDTGSSPGLGRSHMPWSNKARAPQLLSLHSRAREPHY